MGAWGLTGDARTPEREAPALDREAKRRARETARLYGEAKSLVREARRATADGEPRKGFGLNELIRQLTRQPWQQVYSAKHSKRLRPVGQRQGPEREPEGRDSKLA